MSDKPLGSGRTRRDAETLWVLGAFQIVLAIPVFIGTFYVEERFPALVNFLAAAVTMLIGVLFVWRGFWINNHLDE
jgi:threonine/homoserine/homoserine lactone efflux protein